MLHKLFPWLSLRQVEKTKDELELEKRVTEEQSREVQELLQDTKPRSQTLRLSRKANHYGLAAEHIFGGGRTS